MRFLYVGLLFQRKYNPSATQIVLPILHFVFSSHFGKFGVLFKNYEITFSKNVIEVLPTQIRLLFFTQHNPKNA